MSGLKLLTLKTWISGLVPAEAGITMTDKFVHDFIQYTELNRTDYKHTLSLSLSQSFKPHEESLKLEILPKAIIYSIYNT